MSIFKIYMIGSVEPKKQEKYKANKWGCLPWIILYIIPTSLCAFVALPNLLGQVGSSLVIISNNVLRLRRVNKKKEKFYINNDKFASYEELKELDSEHDSILSSTRLGYYNWYNLKIITKDNITLTLAEWKEIPDDPYELTDIITGVKYNRDTKTFT